MNDPRVLLETPRFNVLEHETAYPSGARRRQVIDHPGAAVILPLLASSGPSDGLRVVLIRNHRVAVGETLIELPAGTLEPPEPPIETARRELTEETGFTAGRLEPLVKLWMSPGILRERTHGFVATGLTPGPPRREPGEEIENLIVPLSDAIGMIRCGEIQDAKSVATLLHFHAFGEPRGGRG